jgi:RNA-binding protein
VKLSSLQRKHLESLANSLEPIIRIGKQGLEANIVLSLNEAFNKHELIKIKILDTAPVEARDVSELAIEETGATLVRIIVRTIVLYKPFEDKPKKIELPNTK